MSEYLFNLAVMENLTNMFSTEFIEMLAEKFRLINYEFLINFSQACILYDIQNIIYYPHFNLLQIYLNVINITLIKY